MEDTTAPDALAGPTLPKQDLTLMLEGIRRALEVCKAKHSNKCNRSRSHLLRSESSESSLSTSTARLVVLDVETLEQQTISFHDPFIALSYVWGRKADAASWVNADDKGSKRISIDRLPQTLTDAIPICRLLGYRYIWIDQLCIDQNNPTAVNALVHQMDRIYALATATIIVACNTCADEGIVSEIQLDRHVPSANWPDELGQSDWSKRAWTYQEMQLSRRLIVITRSGIFFHCAQANRSVPTWSLPSIDHISCWSAYNTIVVEYTSRRLSHKTDTLNAIAGMARSLARFTDDSFIAGIPLRQIEWGILWQPTGSSVRQPQWPSWSWAGWTGHEQSMCTVIHPSHRNIQMNHDGDPHRGRQFYSMLRGIQFHAADLDIQLNISSKNRDPGSFHRSLEHCSDNCMSPCTKLANLVSDKPFYDNGILTFTAKVLKISIEPTHQRSSNYPQLYQCRLLLGDVWVGSMFLAEDHLPKNKIIDAEFVVLTSFRAYVHDYKDTVFGDMLESEQELGAFQDQFLKRAREAYDRDLYASTRGKYCTVIGRIKQNRTAGDEFHDPHHGMPFPPELAMAHVLWIVRDDVSGLAYRKGLGIVASTWPGREETVRLA